MSLCFWAWPYLGFVNLSWSFSCVNIIYMLFLSPGWIDPSRLLGGREPIILWKLQKIRAILSALFLGRHIKGALEPEHRYHSGPWLKVNLTVPSLLQFVVLSLLLKESDSAHTLEGAAWPWLLPSLHYHKVKCTLNCLNHETHPTLSHYTPGDRSASERKPRITGTEHI